MNQIIHTTWNGIEFAFDCYAMEDRGDRWTPPCSEFVIEGVKSETHPELADWLAENIDNPLFAHLVSELEKEAFAKEY
jgi:hypothetical protein